MANVFNWQISRNMLYKYEPSYPDRQIAWVFDINKCIACQTCTIACKTTWTSGKGEEYMFWNNVETKPYGFYPLGWDVKLLDKLKMQEWKGNTYEGNTVFEVPEYGEEIAGYMPEDRDWASPNLGEDEVIEKIEDNAYFNLPHNTWMFYLQRICNHCSYPACLAGCPRKSIYKRKEDGIVLIDQDRCRGYRECVKACPYKKPMFNAITGKSEKCIACYPFVEKNKVQRCVETCIGKIRLTGFINRPDKAREDNPIDYLVHIKKVALPLYPQFGTEPNVYYIPPIHVNSKYLVQMFGPGVSGAQEIYRNADERLAGLMMLFGSSNEIIDTFSVKDGIAYGARDGKETVKVPVKEPTAIRPFHDEKLNVYRHSIT